MSASGETSGALRSLTVAALVLLLLAAGAALLLPLLTYPFGRDQGAFASVADVIAAGGVPYRDAWEMKPPGIFYLFWASFAVFGRSMLSPRLLDLLCTLATAAALWSLGRRLLSNWAGAVGAFLFIIRYVAGHSYWNTTQCESFASVPLTLAAITLIAAERRRSFWLAVACGALVGVAVALKFTVGMFLLLPCIALLTSHGEARGPRASRAGAYLLGCVLPLAALAGLLWRTGALSHMLEILFVWNAKYATLKPPMTSFAREIVHFLVGGGHAMLFPIGLLALIGAADLTLRREAGRVRWLLPAWALAMVAAAWIQGKYYTYHWLPVLPPLGLLAGQGLRGLWRALRRAAAPRAAVASYCVVLLALSAVLGSAYWDLLKYPVRYAFGRIPPDTFARGFERRGLGAFSLRADREVAEFISDHTPAGAPTFVWGFEPLIYFLADRPPASRFIYTVPLVTEWSPPEWREELVRELEEKSPPCIVVASNDFMPWMTGRNDDSSAQLAAYSELRQLLDSRYRPVRDVGNFRIWQLR
ncbi:MAG: glycosyltransferase family 39 protein [Armatimonadota bacterium]|nr:MAG: glycosyltransferase family 39 protein [Armatimonadota bacterium]